MEKFLQEQGYKIVYKIREIIGHFANFRVEKDGKSFVVSVIQEGDQFKINDIQELNIEGL
jgi:hypothetical protein